MKQQKKKVIISVKPNGKKQSKFKKQIEKVVWDIYENGQQYHRGGINE